MDRAAELEMVIERNRGELHAHCYRMLGSVHEADDALQDALLSAWKARDGFEGRSSMVSWVYGIATNACLKIIAKREKRVTAPDYRAAASPDAELDAMAIEVPWIEPYPEDPHASFEQRELVELAYIAALQHLPGSQRAALLLCEVIGFTAAQVAEMLDTTVAAVTSAIERARANVAARIPAKSQQLTLRELGDAGQRKLVAAFVDAWGRGDAKAIVAMLARDARFTMPPIPSWFLGRDDIERFLAERVFATPWRLVPLWASGQLAFACYQGPDFELGALNVVTLEGREIIEMTGFLDPAVHAFFSIRTDEFPAVPLS